MSELCSSRPEISIDWKILFQKRATAVEIAQEVPFFTIVYLLMSYSNIYTVNIDINTSGLPARLQRALSKMAEV